MSVAAFKVNLAELLDAKGTVATEAQNIHTLIGQITNEMQMVTHSWIGPAGGAFAQTQIVATADMNALAAVLDDIVTRLGAAYDNYQSMEMQNTTNLTQHH